MVILVTVAPSEHMLSRRNRRRLAPASWLHLQLSHRKLEFKDTVDLNILTQVAERLHLRLAVGGAEIKHKQVTNNVLNCLGTA